MAVGNGPSIGTGATNMIGSNSGSGNPSPANPLIGKNVLSTVGSNSTTVTLFNGGSASGSGSSSSSGLSPDQGSGPPNKPSPNAGLLSTVAGQLSPDQGAGPANKPTPPMSLLNTVGSKSAGAPSGVQQPAWGGTASAIGRNDADPNKEYPKF